MKHLDKNAILQVAGADFSIGVHNIIPSSISAGTTCLDVAKSICEEGLFVNRGEGGTAATVRLFGTLQDVNTEDLERYFYGFDHIDDFDLLERWLEEGNCEELFGVIVAIPSTIEGSECVNYFVGDYPNFYGLGISAAEQKNQDGMSFPMEQYIKTIGYIPREFILGYMYSFKSDMSFYPNEHFVGVMTQHVQSEFYDSLITDMIIKGVKLDKNYSKESLDFMRSMFGYPGPK